MKKVLSLLVDNTAGVLSRVSGLFSRRGYNITSLTVGETADPRYSRMTVVAEGDEQTLEQITKQLGKLIDVLDIRTLHPDDSVNRELVLVKVRAVGDQRQDVITLANVFRGRTVDVGHDSLIIELTGQQSKLDAFLRLIQNYEILELARTGITGLTRGSEDVRYL
ncbi:MAG: acetolactate synthase small subunit [Lachnospiraceae bacterium]|nr:acetolactate synthase small subunit [Lachnospiraceae bacterium]